MDPESNIDEVLEAAKNMFEAYPDVEYFFVDPVYSAKQSKRIKRKIEEWQGKRDCEIKRFVAKPKKMSKSPMKEEIGELLLSWGEELDVDHMLLACEEKCPLHRFLYGSAPNAVLSSESRDYPITVIPR